MFELVHLVLDVLKLFEGRERGLMHRRARLEVYVLFEKSQPHAASAHNVAAVGRLFARDEAEERRLARAVAADQADVLAGIDLQRRTAQNVLRGVRLVNVRQAEKHKSIVKAKGRGQK